jgi:glycosyltransferase involved in cell wall biosynthesis
MGSVEFHPLVSVIIPVFNGANFLERAIASALAQTYRHIEVLVVNDGSTDDGATRTVAERFGEQIRYFEKPNGGVASALNMAISRMNGDYVAWLSHDDEFRPDKLDKQIHLIEGVKDRQNVVLFGGFQIENLVTGTTSLSPLFSSQEMGTGGLYRWLRAIFSSRLHGCTTLIPKALFDRFGLFDERLRTTQDYDFFCRLLRGGVQFLFQEEHLILTRHHKEQGTLSQMDVHLQELDDFFSRTIEQFRPEIVGWRLIYVNELFFILRQRGQQKAWVQLYNAWCSGQCPEDAPPLWLYWECAPGTVIPEYILLCWKTIALHCSRDLRIHAVTPDTLAGFLPALDPCYKQLDAIAHRADFIRFNLLLQYGGIWLDSDMVMFRSVAPVLAQIEHTGFAAMGYHTTAAPGFFPIISFLAARAGNPIVAEMVEGMRTGIIKKLSAEKTQPNWDELGGHLLAEIMTKAPGRFTFILGGDYFSYMPYWYQNLPSLEEHTLVEVLALLHPGMYCQALTNSRDMPVLSRLGEREIIEGTYLLSQLFRVAFCDMPIPCHTVPASASTLQVSPSARAISVLKTKMRTAREIVMNNNGMLGRVRHLIQRVLQRLKSRPAAGGAPRAVEDSGDPVPMAAARDIFTRAYEENIWNHPESRSGEGSTLAGTMVIRGHLPELFSRYQVQSFLDLPCGDFNWMKHVDLCGVRYIGGDIVAPLIAANQKAYGNADRLFLELDLTSDPLPVADMMLCRDCLIHLSFADITRFLDNLHRSGIRYLLTNTYPERHNNIDIETGRFRPVNLALPPFSFPPPVWLVHEGCSPDSSEEERRFSDKSLGLWVVADLPRTCVPR